MVVKCWWGYQDCLWELLNCFIAYDVRLCRQPKTLSQSIAWIYNMCLLFQSTSSIHHTSNFSVSSSFIIPILSWCLEKSLPVWTTIHCYDTLHFASQTYSLNYWPVHLHYRAFYLTLDSWLNPLFMLGFFHFSQLLFCYKLNFISLIIDIVFIAWKNFIKAWEPEIWGQKEFDKIFKILKTQLIKNLILLIGNWWISGNKIKIIGTLIDTISLQVIKKF